MTDIALFVPYGELLDQAEAVLSREAIVEVAVKKVVVTADSVEEARKAVAEGIGVIIARGLQASLIKRYTNIPVVEIRLTGQELCILIDKAKKLIRKELPFIGFVGFDNMFCGMDSLEDVFGVRLKQYFIRELDEIEDEVRKAKSEGVDLIIGGEATREAAARAGVRNIYFESTEDSLIEAFKTAQLVQYAAKIEKNSNIQLNSLMEYSYHGVLRLNGQGLISGSNHIMEQILNKQEDRFLNQPISQVLPEIEGFIVADILSGRKDSYSTIIKVGGKTMMVLAGAVQIDEKIEGIILSFYQIEKNRYSYSEKIRETFLQGYIAEGDFSDILNPSPAMKKTIELAKIFSSSKSALLLYGEAGTEKELIAQSIHNYSKRQNGPYISASCSGLSGDQQISQLFGGDGKEKGLLSTCNHGTLVIHDAESMDRQCQHRLWKAMHNKVFIKGEGEQLNLLDVRIIITSEKSLQLLVDEGLFLKDLFYLFNGLSIEILPLRKRKEEISAIGEYWVNHYCRIYSRYFVLTDGAKKALQEYDWPGNLIQMKSFCERVVLTCNKRSIGADFINRLLQELYPFLYKGRGQAEVVVFQSKEGMLIAEALERNHGNRNQTAKELGISTSTLWRHMKKYGIEHKYKSPD